MSTLRYLAFALVLAPAFLSPSLDAQEVRGSVASEEPTEARASEIVEEDAILRTLGVEALDLAVSQDEGQGLQVHGEGFGFSAKGGLKAPDPEEIGRCIVRRYSSEPEVGYSYAIAKRGVVEASGAGGWARAPWERAAGSIAMQDTTRMTLASVSKPITALAMMKLMEETSVDLDDAFYPFIADKYDGYWYNTQGQLMFVPNPGVETVTIRNLLTHRSGLKPGLGCGKIPESLASGLTGTPGVTYDYENANFCILRQVIEEVSGMDYISYVQSKILFPAGVFGMNCTPDALAPALYYNTIGTAGKNWGDYSSTCSAYGWYGSAVDLATLLGQVRVGGILTANSVDTMLGNCPDSDTTGYCLGWRRYFSTSLGGDYFGHSGDWIAGGCGGDCNRGLNSTIRRYSQGIDAALLVNTRSGSGGNPTLTSEAYILNSCYAEALATANP